MAESRFYYPITVHQGASSASIDTPFVCTIPLNQNLKGSAIILSADEGSANQGLYIWDDRRWRFALPQLSVSVGVIDGYTIDVYYDVLAPITVFPEGSIVFRNGVQMSTPEILPGFGTVYAVMTPVSSSAAGTVKSVNGVEPDSEGNVQLTADDIGAIDVDQLGVPDGVATLDGNGWVPMPQLPPGIIGGLQYQGAYNAATDTPPLPAPDPSNKGYYWVVSAAGTQQGLELRIGDWIVSNGTSYDKIDNQEGRVLSVNGALPDPSDGNVEIPVATTTTAGTVYAPTSGGLSLEADGELTISQEIINQIGFTPIRVLYVAANGNPTTGTGTINNPFSTISGAVTAATDGTAIIVRSPGTYVENVIIDDKQVALLTEPGSAFNNMPVSIQGFLQLTGTKVISVQDLGIRWSSAGAGFRVTRVGTTAGFRVSNLVITTSSAAQAVQIDASGGAWTGSLIIDGLYTNDGKIQIDEGYTSIRMMPQDSNSIVEVNGGTLDLSSVWRLLRLDHTNGAVYVRDVRMIGSSAAAPAIVSSAPFSATNVLALSQVSTWTSATVQSFVNKTGTCVYIVDRLTRNLTSDVWTGTELAIKGNYDRDTLATRAGVNYTGLVGAYLSTHLQGIDNALGLRLSTLTSAGGNTLVSNGPSGILKGLASGAGIQLAADANTVTVSATGVQTLTSVAGGTSLVQAASGTLRALAEGSGITLTEAAGVITITSSAASGVSTVNGLSGDITLAIGQGISLTPVGQTLTFANTGVLTLTSVVSAGSYSLVNASTGELKNIRPGVGVTMSEASGVVTINSTGGGGGGVSTLNGLQGDVELVPGSNIAINTVGNTLVINSTGGGSGGLSAVTNTSGTDPGLVADDGASTGTATIKRIKAGTNVTLTESIDDLAINVDIGDYVESLSGLTGPLTVSAGTDIGILAENGVITISYTGSSAGTKVSNLNGLIDGVTLTSPDSHLVITPDTLGGTIDLAVSGFVTQVDNASSSAPGATALLSDNGSSSGIAVAKQFAPGANVQLDDDGSTITFNVTGGTGDVKSVNGVTPEDPVSGNVQIDASTVGALPIDGGQMQGPIDMFNQAINNLPDPVDDADPVTLGYLGSGDLIIDNGEI